MRLPLLIALGITMTTSIQGPRPITDADSYAVYASVIGAGQIEATRAPRLIISEDVVPWGCIPSGGAMKGDWKPVLDDFIKENAGGRQIREGFDIGKPYVVAPAADAKRLRDHLANPARVPPPPPPPSRNGSGAVIPPPQPTEAEKAFASRYSGGFGVTSLTAVGFDRAHRRALFGILNYCGGLCASTSFSFLQKIGTEWERIQLPGVNACMGVA